MDIMANAEQALQRRIEKLAEEKAKRLCAPIWRFIPGSEADTKLWRELIEYVQAGVQNELSCEVSRDAIDAIDGVIKKKFAAADKIAAKGT